MNEQHKNKTVTAAKCKERTKNRRKRGSIPKEGNLIQRGVSNMSSVIEVVAAVSYYTTIIMKSHGRSIILTLNIERNFIFTG